MEKFEFVDKTHKKANSFIENFKIFKEEYYFLKYNLYIFYPKANHENANSF